MKIRQPYCYKQSRQNTLVLGATRGPTASPTLQSPPQAAHSSKPFLKPKGRKEAFVYFSETILLAKFSSVRYCLQVQDHSKNIWHSILLPPEIQELHPTRLPNCSPKQRLIVVTRPPTGVNGCSDVQTFTSSMHVPHRFRSSLQPKVVTAAVHSIILLLHCNSS